MFQTTLILTFPLVKETNLLKKYALYFSFFEENSKCIATCFLSSNNRGIISSSFFVLKFLIVFSVTYIWKTCVYLLSSNSFYFFIKVQSYSRSSVQFIYNCIFFVLKGTFRRPVYRKLFCIVIDSLLNSLINVNNFSI